ncbi:ATP-binding protein [Paraburkholderia sp. SIMBA_030]|uniref:ATP-binding response regulator n=1 Tax=Paraburkholderia sp. SIMBA_030 TaxID=3085773 RepID=UPI00397984DC
MAAARILIVEDDRVVARDIAQQMNRAGHTVIGITARGEDALPLAADTAPDLVLMDVRLEGELDGVDTARLMRENFNLPVVFLTAYADEETVRRATVTEPFGYVLKPFDDTQLRTVVEMALYKHGVERRLRESEQRYAVTLSSIGDAVIATGRDSRISFINPVAEMLTGWARDEAMGRPLAEVFRVINETTRAPAKDPVTAVLSAGTIVGLANHTILLSRDGREIAIDDSGSPIVDDRGEILGVVLVFRDVTQRRRAEEAESANRAKDQFLANISHELRTPLNGILGYAQILRRDAAMTERQLSSLRVIEQSGEHLLMLINDILDFARIEAGKFELNVTDVPLGPFLRVIAEMVSVRADQKNLVVNREAPANLSKVIRVDEKRLRQVLLNLLVNAVKFTDQGEVTLVVRMISNGRLRFEVRDTGVGVSPDRLETIFQPFEQAGDFTRRTGGVGLGLAISRQLVRMMGGEIHVASTVGSGSTFWFELDAPVSYADVADFSPPLQIPADEGEERHVLVIDEPVVPPRNEMETLHRFALLGSMRDIVHHADYLIGLDVRYEAFAMQLRRLAAAFESQALLSLIEQHLDRDA